VEDIGLAGCRSIGEPDTSSFDGPISVREVQAGEQFLRYTGDPASSGPSLVLDGRIAGGAEGITQTVVIDPGALQFSAGQPYP